MKSAILIHGWNTKTEFFDPLKPTASNDHWFPWLSKQLMVNGIKADAPEMPQYELSTYESWKREVERFDITADTILIGHSCGGGFIIRYLSENAVRVGKVFLVAPWLGLDFGEKFDEHFFEFEFDRELVGRTDGVTIIGSNDDFEAITKSIEKIRDNVDNIRYIGIENKGHFTRTSLGTDAFPELLQEILS